MIVFRRWKHPIQRGGETDYGNKESNKEDSEEGGKEGDKEELLLLKRKKEEVIFKEVKR